MRQAGQKRSKEASVWRGAEEREGEGGVLEGCEEKEGGLEAVFPLGPVRHRRGERKQFSGSFAVGCKVCSLLAFFFFLRHCG